MWEIICEFLLHPHIWLRNISNRLIELYFKNSKTTAGSFLMRPSRLFFLAASFCSQLTASLTGDESKRLIENIVFTILRLHSMLGQQNESQVFWSTLEQKDEEILLRGFVILDSRKGRSMFAFLASGLNGHVDIESCEKHRYLLISSLIKTMGKIALDVEDDQVCNSVCSFYSLHCAFFIFYRLLESEARA